MGQCLAHPFLISKNCSSLVPIPRRHYLPNETWHDVLHFVPFRHLHQSISLVSAHFSALAQPLLDTLCPRSVHYLIINWDPQLDSPCLELLPFDKSPPLSYRRVLSTLGTKCLPLPNRPPPTNIIKIKEIQIERHIDQQVVAFLLQCRPKITSYHLNVSNFGKFTRELADDGIQLQEFLDVLGKNCSSMYFWCHGDDLMPLMDSEQLLNCPSLEFSHLCSPLDGPKLIKWLKRPLANGMPKGLIVRVSTIWCRCTDQQHGKITEQIRMMVQELIREHRENGDIRTVRFTIRLFGIQLAMEPFRDGVLELCQERETDWALINDVGSESGEEQENKCTLIKVGWLADRSCPKERKPPKITRFINLCRNYKF